MKKLYIIGLLTISNIFSISAMEVDVPLDNQLIHAEANTKIKITTIRILLLCAAKISNINTVNILIKPAINAYSIHEHNKYTASSLYSFEKSYTRIVKLLIKTHANINIKNNKGWTPLHSAAKEGYTEIVKLLINNGANINIKTNKGWTPLHIAAENKHTEIVKLLIDADAYVNSTNKRKEHTPLLCATYHGYETIAELLINNGANIEAVNKYSKNTPLLYAAGNGYTKIAELLINNGANIEAVNKYNKNTPLLRTVGNGYTKIVKLLINNGVNIDAVNRHRNTPLLRAALYGYTKIVKLLINNGANIKAVNKHSNTPLLYAAAEGFKEVVKILTTAPIVFNNALSRVENKVNFEQSKFFDVANKINYTGLMCKFSNNFPEPAMKVLCKSIFPLNNWIEKEYIKKFALECYKQKETPLSKMFFKELYKQHLSQLKIYISITNNANKTAIDKATENNKQDIIDYLEEIKNTKKYDDLDDKIKKQIEQNYQLRLKYKS